MGDDRDMGDDRAHRIVSVQALRAVAAVAVLLHHVAFFELKGFAAGVDVFFVLSGFIMVVTCWPEFGQEGATRRFMARRLARIVPLYWIATAVVVIAAHLYAQKAIGLPQIFNSLLFYPFTSKSPVLNVGWTLNFEMTFYLLFATALFLRPRMAVLAVSAALALLVIGGLLFGPVPRNNVAFPLSIEFIFGMVIGLAYREGLVLSKPLALALLAAGLGFIIASVADGWIASNKDPLRFLLWGVPAAAAVAGATLTRWNWRGLTARVAEFLGDASYSLYLFHLPIIGLLAYNGMHWKPLVIAICLAASTVIHLCVERPMLRWFKGRRTRDTTPRPAPRVAKARRLPANLPAQ